MMVDGTLAPNKWPLRLSQFSHRPRNLAAASRTSTLRSSNPNPIGRYRRRERTLIGSQSESTSRPLRGAPARGICVRSLKQLQHLDIYNHAIYDAGADELFSSKRLWTLTSLHI